MIVIAIGREITIPQNPAITPPANTAKMLTNAGNWLVFPYTFGPMMYPSIFGHTMHTIIVNINNLGLITAAIMTAKILTSNPPKSGIMVVTAASILNTR